MPVESVFVLRFRPTHFLIYLQQTSDAITKEPVSSSDVQSPPFGGMTFGKPHPFTVDGIHDLIKRFAFAAKTLYDAGADGIQFHAAVCSLAAQILEFSE
jgi:2,4-dienoyl-CoA reductase-like NADH-dependent reductase (Old Yellow Enzyme family)